MCRFKVIIIDREDRKNKVKFDTNCVVASVHDPVQSGNHVTCWADSDVETTMSTCAAAIEGCRKLLAPFAPNDLAFKKIMVDMFINELSDEEETEASNEG